MRPVARRPRRRRRIGRARSRPGSASTIRCTPSICSSVSATAVRAASTRVGPRRRRSRTGPDVAGRSRSDVGVAGEAGPRARRRGSRAAACAAPTASRCARRSRVRARAPARRSSAMSQQPCAPSSRLARIAARLGPASVRISSSRSSTRSSRRAAPARTPCGSRPGEQVRAGGRLRGRLGEAADERALRVLVEVVQRPTLRRLDVQERAAGRGRRRAPT